MFHFLILIILQTFEKSRFIFNYKKAFQNIKVLCKITIEERVAISNRLINPLVRRLYEKCFTTAV